VEHTPNLLLGFPPFKMRPADRRQPPMPIDPHQVQAVFFAAAVCDDSSERAIVLEQQCGNNTELRNRVLALLKADDESNELPPPRVPDSDAICHPSAEYAPGMVIAGLCRLLEEIAQGGMGTI
jgi:hypothetical protein